MLRPLISSTDPLLDVFEKNMANYQIAHPRTFLIFMCVAKGVWTLRNLFVRINVLLIIKKK